MSKTFKDLPERIRAEKVQKNSSILEKNKDRSFMVNQEFIFKSTSVDAIEEFKNFIEENGSKPFESKEVYGYLLEENKSWSGENPLDDEAFPFLRKIEKLAPFSKIQKVFSEKFEAQDAYNRAKEEEFKHSRKIIGPDLFTVIKASFYIKDVSYKEDSEMKLPHYMKKNEDKEKRDYSSSRQQLKKELLKEMKS